MNTTTDELVEDLEDDAVAAQIATAKCCIGDSGQSESFLLSLLLKLTQKCEEYKGDEVCELDEQFEQDVCVLWDMTVDKDIGLYILEKEADILFRTVAAGSNAPRLREICVGVLNNMMCHAEVRAKMIKDATILKFATTMLRDDDPDTLLGAIQMLCNLFWYLKNGCNAKLWEEWLLSDCSYLCEQFSFILKSSTNGQILSKSLEFLFCCLTYFEDGEHNSQLCSQFACAEFIGSANEAIEQFRRNDELQTEISATALENYITCLHVISDHDSGKQILFDSSATVANNCNELLLIYDLSDGFESIIDLNVDVLCSCAAILTVLLNCSFSCEAGKAFTSMTNLAAKLQTVESSSEFQYIYRKYCVSLMNLSSEQLQHFSEALNNLSVCNMSFFCEILQKERSAIPWDHLLETFQEQTRLSQCLRDIQSSGAVHNQY